MKAIQEWTPARATELETLWNAGHTANRIAEIMAIPGGKNAIIGKANRLGLEKRKSYSRSREEYKKMREERRLLPRPPRKNASPRPLAPRVAVERPAPLEEPVSRAILFAKRLTGIECAWIAGEPDAKATCCGHRCKFKSQFCGFHHARAWVMPEPRTR